MSEYQYTQTKPKIGRARLTIWIALAGILILLVWAYFAKIDQVTRAKATVIASARTQEIQASEGGVLTDILVSEGDDVKKGDLIVVLEEERAKAALADTSAKVASLKANLARLEAEIYDRPLVFPDDVKKYPEYVQNQTQQFVRNRRSINEELSNLGAILNLSLSELNKVEPLLQYGDVSEVEIIQLRRKVSEIQSEMSNKQNEYFKEAQTELTKTQEELDSELEQFRDRQQVLLEKRLHAPLDGKVNNINITTIGGVVKPGEVIMELLPTSSALIIEAKVSPADIAYVKEDQAASVKLDAYDFSIFGAMNGKVIYISPDTLMEKTPKGEEPYYRVLIEIGEAEFAGRGSEITIKPGMTASVDIKAMERTVLSYLTKPITKTLSEGLGER